jgi:hypothetical protein
MRMPEAGSMTGETMPSGKAADYSGILGFVTLQHNTAVPFLQARHNLDGEQPDHFQVESHQSHELRHETAPAV